MGRWGAVDPYDDVKLMVLGEAAWAGLVLAEGDPGVSIDVPEPAWGGDPGRAGSRT